MNLFRRKSVTDLQAEALTDHSLKRALGAVNLTALGIGAIIGTGIFVLTGTVAAQNAGPAVVLSFVLAGVASVFAALCYSEFAALVPMAGSAYTYGYATLGELVAWIIGWDLILEYAVGAITVAIGWSGYVVSFLHDFGINIPPALSAPRCMRLGIRGVTCSFTSSDRCLFARCSSFWCRQSPRRLSPTANSTCRIRSQWQPITGVWVGWGA